MVGWVDGCGLGDGCWVRVILLSAGLAWPEQGCSVPPACCAHPHAHLLHSPTHMPTRRASNQLPCRRQRAVDPRAPRGHPPRRGGQHLAQHGPLRAAALNARAGGRRAAAALARSGDAAPAKLGTRPRPVRVARPAAAASLLLYDSQANACECSCLLM